MVEEGVELILGIWRCCGVVIQGQEAAIKAIVWGTSAETRARQMQSEQ